MRAGSVIVDLAAERAAMRADGAGEEVVRERVTLVGHTNLPSTVPVHASQLLSRNISALLMHLAPEGELRLDWEDEITSGSCVTRQRKSRRERSARRELTIFALAVFLGIELISKVPTMLHTPLMSGTNAIHGIVLIGAMVIAGTADSTLEKALAFVAVVFGTINIVGGFLVTDRMLEMFKRRPDEEKPPE